MGIDEILVCSSAHYIFFASFLVILAYIDILGVSSLSHLGMEILLSTHKFLVECVAVEGREIFIGTGLEIPYT